MAQALPGSSPPKPRKQAAADTITLIGDEPEAPYSRMAIPYLLMGNIGEPGTYLRKSMTHLPTCASSA